LKNETEALFVGYFEAVVECVLALIAIIAVITFFSSSEEFLATYSSFTDANQMGLGIFVEGAAQLFSGLAIPTDIATTIVSIIVVSFAATSLDTRSEERRVGKECIY